MNVNLWHENETLMPRLRGPGRKWVAMAGAWQRSDKAVAEKHPSDLAPGKPLVTSESQLGQERAQEYDSAGQ